MKEFFADLHVHIGRAENGRPVKITAAKSLNFANIAKECAFKKGIQIVGIVDCASPYVIQDIENFLKIGEAYELQDGGIIYQDKVCIILGSEIETCQIDNSGKVRLAHSVAFFPYLENIKEFSKCMNSHIRNMTLSSQRANINSKKLLEIVQLYNGFLMPAHIFTPHKSFYGNCTSRLENIFEEEFDNIFSVELGLSSDTLLADEISELERMTFITNSDAHSLPKIAREYNKIRLEQPNFKELIMALKREGERAIICNYGLNPKFGKYHRTYCEKCDKNIDGEPPATSCSTCDSKNITMGVLDRIQIIKDKLETKSPAHRPEYMYHTPLTFIPGIGPKIMDKLLNNFNTEMNVIHTANRDDLESVTNAKVANNIILAREGKLKIQEGGGGIYGKLVV